MLIDVITAKKQKIGWHAVLRADQCNIVDYLCKKRGGTGAVRLQIHDYFLTVCSLGNIHNHAIGYLCRLGI